VGTTGGGRGADGCGEGERYGFGTDERPGGGVVRGGRVRGGRGKRPVGGIGGRLKSLRALLRISKVFV
jgi:hypothetical protein